MIPMRTSTIFKSRWMALLWAAGILWFAYDFAGSSAQQSPQSNDGSSTSGTSDDENKISQALGN